MSLTFLVFPRQSATPGELMDLASALDRWRSQERAASGVAPDICSGGLSDLKNGLLPTVVDGVAVDRPAVRVAVPADRYSRELALQTLSREIPMCLVDEIQDL